MSTRLSPTVVLAVVGHRRRCLRRLRGCCARCRSQIQAKASVRPFALTYPPPGPPRALPAKTEKLHTHHRFPFAPLIWAIPDFDLFVPFCHVLSLRKDANQSNILGEVGRIALNIKRVAASFLTSSSIKAVIRG